MSHLWVWASCRWCAIAGLFEREALVFELCMAGLVHSGPFLAALGPVGCAGVDQLVMMELMLPWDQLVMVELMLLLDQLVVLESIS